MLAEEDCDAVEPDVVCVDVDVDVDDVDAAPVDALADVVQALGVCKRTVRCCTLMLHSELRLQRFRPLPQVFCLMCGPYAPTVSSHGFWPPHQGWSTVKRFIICNHGCSKWISRFF